MSPMTEAKDHNKKFLSCKTSNRKIFLSDLSPFFFLDEVFSLITTHAIKLQPRQIKPKIR